MMVVVKLSTGRVVRFNPESGYGFIAADDGGEDVFVHVREAGELQMGARVEYSTVAGQRGLKAYKVRVLPDSTPAPAPVVKARQDSDDDWEAVSEWEFAAEVTNILISECPVATGAQIASVRSRLVELARKYEWIES